MAELLARVSSAELTEWMAYERITGPLGPERGDALHGILTATVANTARSKGRKARPQDFIPQWAGKVRQDWTEMLAAVRAANRAMGGADLTEHGRGDADVDHGGAPGRGRHGRRRADRRR
ncbi:hypothetical protein [Kitasatospora sp. MBT63]|uniref:phage tail assembly protein T n=1 Tax=Kitasatospora sp. MBT63 TaxID=1444768 RepID=UPI000A8C4932|nr:hypothetical protein [Kitasatospora sp. MBT63]